jgi:quinoprotein glucose dehydrogenase
VKKNVIALLALVGMCAASAPIADFPSAKISNGLIEAELHLPDAQKGYYRGVRFDWAGVIPRLEYKGHSYFGEWNPSPYDATLHDNITGPVEEFMPVGYDEAEAGGAFLKIGVGILTKPDAKKYLLINRYAIKNGGKWTVSPSKDRVEFLHELTDATGYGYLYRKTVKLTNGKPEMVLEHSLKNTGQKTIETAVYNHNFFRIDQELTGPNIKTSFPFEVQAEGKNFGTIAKAENKTISYLKTLETGDYVYSEGLKGFGNTAKDYDIFIQNLKSGAGVRITSDQPIDRLVHWACRTTSCPEPYIKLSVKPQEEVRWTIKYAFESKARADNQNTDWPKYGGNSAGSRYSELDEINLQNVHKLQMAWAYDTGENTEPDKSRDIQCQPIVVNGVMYGVAPSMKVFAVAAGTGKEIWKFDPFKATKLKPNFHAVRAVVYWEEGNDKRILYSVGSQLMAINAQTGEIIKSFGKNGLSSLHAGLGDQQTMGYDVNQFSIRSTSPGVIFKNLLIMGSALSEGGDALPGHIRAFDVKTGQLAWVFRTVPIPGDYGYETWAKDSYKKIGGANCWAGMVVDDKRGMVFIGTGSPSVDFYGGDRPGANLFGNCVIALNAQTGERIWHFQTVHHDLWDRDIPCPPNLITVTHNGPDGRPRKIEAVAQATKDGLIFVFDRDTGQPLFPVIEVPVPKVPALPGEKPWPTQPVPTKPAPFSNQNLAKADMSNLSPAVSAYVLKRYATSRSGPKNLPPSTQQTLYYGIGGGAEWGGSAADPNGVLYVNANNMLWFHQMRAVKDQNNGAALTKGAKLFNTNCAVCHALGGKNSTATAAGAYPALQNVSKRLTKDQVAVLLESGRGRMPAFQHISKEDRAAIIDFLWKNDQPKTQKSTPDEVHDVAVIEKKSGRDFPYAPPYLNNGFVQFRDQNDHPAIKPPWGTLNAVDLNTGEYLWKVPLGEYPELTKKGILNTGTENHGGPVVTAGGLLFIAATYDEKLRAFNTKTGKVVWEYKLPAGGFATPITYSINGKQYVAIAAGGHRYGLKPGGKYVAFALP